MLQTMKNKALQLDQEARSGAATEASTETAEDEASDDDESSDSEAAPKYTAITQALQALKPESLTVVDTSQDNGGGAETHFEVSVVASAFEGLNVIKRQQLVFMMLGEVQVEGLQIASMFTPDEAQDRA